MAAPIRESRRTQPADLQATVQNLCTGRYLGRHVLARLLDRNPDDLLRRTLNPMVASGALLTAYAASRAPRQAYMAGDRAPRP